MLIGGVYLDCHGALNSIHESPLARKLRAFVALSEAELDVLLRLHRRRRTFDAGHAFLHQGHSQRSAFILASGWVCSYKTLPSGTRQIVDFQVPGDFLGLRSVLLQTSDHFIEAVTRVEVSEVLPAELFDAFRETPRLAAAVLWAASRDEAMVVEHLIDIGRRSAEERVAHLLLEMGFRLSLVGLGDKSGYACPLSQFHLADALGLSAVHVNRVLRKLREEGLVTFRGGKVSFDNFEELVAFVDFDTAYLDQERPLLK